MSKIVSETAVFNVHTFTTKGFVCVESSRTSCSHQYAGFCIRDLNHWRLFFFWHCIIDYVCVCVDCIDVYRFREWNCCFQRSNVHERFCAFVWRVVNLLLLLLIWHLRPLWWDPQIIFWTNECVCVAHIMFCTHTHIFSVSRLSRPKKNKNVSFRFLSLSSKWETQNPKEERPFESSIVQSCSCWWSCHIEQI